ncbi:MAG: bifunctional demethylmenaquinone methyltransferase/2-methoxy-6-polyprenyl-1,4-benzoquinol methylase UbiE [Planctomycetes bacterium]|nr:bifunctional demethylmenaquinone methyltransferase/2-methoxy-6-polyprenyl-1,4-benzoquinol methylase UbiE [Planctomycetota bacterium]
MIEDDPTCRGKPLPSVSLDKKESRIRGMFAEIAPTYDLLNHLLSLNIDKVWRKRVTRLVPSLTGGPILDLCTGTGDLAFAYDRVCGGKTPIIAADFCAEMLVRGVRKHEKYAAASPIQFIEADAQQLPFADQSFEIACVAFGLRNVTDTEKGIAEMVRVLQPGGRLAILEFSKPRHWFFGRMYRLYFRFLLPLIGQMFSRSRQSAYRYLPESVLEFPDGEALAERLRHHGLANVWFKPFTFGIATLYVGIKPDRI